MNKINAEKTKDMVIIGLMAAIICVMGPLSIRLPFTLVPISLTNLAIYFILYVAGTRRTVIRYFLIFHPECKSLPVRPADTLSVSFLWQWSAASLLTAGTINRLLHLRECGSAKQSARHLVQSGMRMLQGFLLRQL